jgi:membrane-anchored protein YejM (alkaline phosphatase superfamily)
MWILVDSFISAQKSYILNLLESYKLQKNIAPIGTGSLAAPRVIQELKHDLAEKKSGQFFFVHLLLPHYSYVYQQDCSVRDWDLWTNPYIKTKKKDAIAARENKYKAYLSQVECTQKLVQGLLDFLHKSGTFDAMSIVIIGDHGSRISVTRWDEYFTKMTKQDYVSWFSALALMKPGIYNTGFARKTGGSDQTALAVIVAEFLKLPLTSKASDFEHVYFPLDDRFVRMEMTDLH